MTAPKPVTVEHTQAPASRFADADLSASVFDGVNLRSAAFSNVALAGARFRDTSFAGATIEDCNLEGFCIDGVPVTELLRAYRGSAAIQPVTNLGEGIQVAAVSLLVRDYDEAITFFVNALRFVLVQDTPLGAGKRWVVVAPAGGGAGLLLALASNEAQRAQVGCQAGGRVCLFLHTNTFDADRAHMQAHGVHFTETPREEAYGRVVVFLDLYGNRWDLIDARPPALNSTE